MTYPLGVESPEQAVFLKASTGHGHCFGASQARLPDIRLFAYHMFRAPSRESGFRAFIQTPLNNFHVSAAHLPHLESLTIGVQR
jgi:hypothetical protein